MPAVAGEYESMITEFKRLVRGNDTQALTDFMNDENNQKIFLEKKSNTNWADNFEKEIQREADWLGRTQENAENTIKRLCGPGALYERFAAPATFGYLSKYSNEKSSVLSFKSEVTPELHERTRELLDAVDPQQPFVSAHPYVIACIGLGMVAAVYYAYQWWTDKKNKKEYEQGQQMHGMGTAGAPVSVLA